MAKNWEEMREKNIGKNWFRLASGKKWGDLWVIVIGTLEVIGICRTSHQPDKCGTMLFYVYPGAGLKLRHARWLQKYLGLRWHSPKKGRLRRQTINLAPPRRIRAWEDWGSRLPVKVHLDRLSLEPGHTRPDLRTDKTRATEVLQSVFF